MKPPKSVDALHSFSDDSNLHKYFTQIPNMIVDMVLEKKIKNEDFMVYCIIKRIAWDKGECKESTSQLAKLCDMSMGQISKSKKRLVDAKLISIREEHVGRPMPAHRVSVIDVWDENFAKYSKNKEQSSNLEESISSPSEVTLHPVNKEAVLSSPSEVTLHPVKYLEDVSKDIREEEREVSATEKPDYDQLQSKADSLSPTDLGKFLMCRMNILHLKHRRRSYCKADGSKWEREVLIDSYKNYADCTVRLFDCFWEQMFMRWDSLACLKWAREKSEPVATTPSLSYLSKNMAVFFDEVLGKSFAKKSEGNGNGKPDDTRAALEKVKQAGGGLSFARPNTPPPVGTPDYPVVSAF